MKKLSAILATFILSTSAHAVPASLWPLTHGPKDRCVEFVRLTFDRLAASYTVEGIFSRLDIEGRPVFLRDELIDFRKLGVHGEVEVTITSITDDLWRYSRIVTPSARYQDDYPTTTYSHLFLYDSNPTKAGVTWDERSGDGNQSPVCVYEAR